MLWSALLVKNILPTSTSLRKEVHIRGHYSSNLEHSDNRWFQLISYNNASASRNLFYFTQICYLYILWHFRTYTKSTVHSSQDMILKKCQIDLRINASESVAHAHTSQSSSWLPLALLPRSFIPSIQTQKSALLPSDIFLSVLPPDYTVYFFGHRTHWQKHHVWNEFLA